MRSSRAGRDMPRSVTRSHPVQGRYLLRPLARAVERTFQRNIQESLKTSGCQRTASRALRIGDGYIGCSGLAGLTPTHERPSVVCGANISAPWSVVMKLSFGLAISTAVVAVVVGCAGVKQSQSGSGSGGGGAASGKGGGSGGRVIDAGSIDLPGSITTTCGNGKLDPGEQCDDGNTVGEMAVRRSVRSRRGGPARPPASRVCGMRCAETAS